MLSYERKKELLRQQEKKIHDSHYDRINPYCASTKLKYDSKQHKVTALPCLQWQCDRCRKILKRKLYDKIIVADSIFGLDKHTVITVKGKQYRSTHTIKQSFQELHKDFIKLRKVIQYHYGKFDYIAFLRSQTDGYAHYHLLSNKYIPKRFIDKKALKYASMGHISIQRNHDIAQYLTNDFWKDHEYVIPENVNHYSCSIEIRPYLTLKQDKSEYTIPMQLNPEYDTYDQIEQTIYKNTGYPPPLETILTYLKPTDKPKMP